MSLVFGSPVTKQKICTICWQSLSVIDSYTQLKRRCRVRPCGHAFHNECLYAKLEGNAQICPACGLHIRLIEEFFPIWAVNAGVMQGLRQNFTEAKVAAIYATRRGQYLEAVHSAGLAGRKDITRLDLGEAAPPFKIGSLNDVGLNDDNLIIILPNEFTFGFNPHSEAHEADKITASMFFTADVLYMIVSNSYGLEKDKDHLWLALTLPVCSIAAMFENQPVAWKPILDNFLTAIPVLLVERLDELQLGLA